MRKILGGVPSADENCGGDYRPWLFEALAKIKTELDDATAHAG